MKFNKVILIFLFVVIVCVIQSALTARLNHKDRSASLHIFVIRRQNSKTKGRSTSRDLLNNPDLPATTDNGEKGRDLIKQFMLFKSLFHQHKSKSTEKTQPQKANTTASDIITTTTITKPTATATADEMDNLILSLEDVNRELGNPQLQAIVQKLKNQKTQKRKRLNNNKKMLQNQKKPIKRVVSKRQPTRKNMQPQQQQQHQINIKRPNHHEKNYNDNQNNNNSKNNNSSNNKASGVFNLNAKMRFQNLMNALRKQTPIMYNY